MALLALAAVLATTTLSGDAATGTPSLRMMSGQSFAVRGQGFRSGERVRVIALGSLERASVRVTANARGAFTAAFRQRDLGGCSLVVLTAIGSDGSRATLKPRRRPCGPPPGPPPRR
jgi:hypothetical protein